MDISFDPIKNARNLDVHGISFEKVVDFDWSLALILEDARRDYGEHRFRALGFIERRLHVLVFTRRDVCLHIISLRKDFMPRERKLKATSRDDDNPSWTRADFQRARPAREVLPKLFGKAKAREMLRPRGRPKSAEPRASISLRVPQQVLARWKATGPGWQTRMVAVLSKAK